MKWGLVVGAVLAVQLAACTDAPSDDPPPPLPPPPGPKAVAGWRTVDLSHAYASDTLCWPTDTTGFRLDTLAEGPTPGGYPYAAREFATAEHGGTHLDAPPHFAEGGGDAASIPLDRLILPGIVIDVAEAAAAAADLPGHSRGRSRVGGRARPGAGRGGGADQDRLGRPLAYLDDDTLGETGDLHFPGIGADATRLLVEDRGAGLVGIDTASIYHGPSTDFIAHRIGAAAGVFNLEESRGPLRPSPHWLPARGAADGDRERNRPVRAVALVPPW